MIVTATVTALQTPDGLCSFEDGVTLGKTYLVELDSIIRQQTMLHQHADGSFQEHTKDIIFVVGGLGWLPLDCLRLSADAPMPVMGR